MSSNWFNIQGYLFITSTLPNMGVYCPQLQSEKCCETSMRSSEPIS